MRFLLTAALALALALTACRVASVNPDGDSPSVSVHPDGPDGHVVMSLNGLPPSTRCQSVAIDDGGHFVEVGPRLVSSATGTGRFEYAVSQSRPDLVATVATIEVICGDVRLYADVDFAQ